MNNQVSERLLEEASELHREYPPVDLHADPLMWAESIGYDLGKLHRPYLPYSAWVGHLDLPRMSQVNIGVQVFGLATNPFKKFGLFRLANRQIDQLDRACLLNPDRLVTARSVGCMTLAKKDGQIAGLLALEGVHLAENRVENIGSLVNRGVRVLGLVHFTPNAAAYPNYGFGVDNDRGLTDFGRRLVELCNQTGVIIDLAHANQRCVIQACACSTRPVIISHTGALGVNGHPRNVGDQELQAVASTDGAVGIIFERRFLGGADVTDVIRHMEYVINVAGEDCVAIGSDWDGMIVPVRGLEHVGRLPNLTAAMLQAGWSRQRIGKVLALNAERVMKNTLPKEI